MEPKMYRKEIQIIVTLISTILIFGFYALYVYDKSVAGDPGIINDFKFWGKTFLVFIPIAIVAMIIIQIIFAIINKIVTKEDIPTKSDEMDKLIELKALRISHWTCMTGFIVAIGSQAFNLQPYWLFIILISSCFLSGIAESLAQIYYYRKGV